MSEVYDWRDVDAMADAIVESIRNDNKDAFMGLLTKNDDFWENRLYDDFLMEQRQFHLLGLCLEHDSVGCALALIESKLPKHDINAKGSPESGIGPALSTALAHWSNKVVEAILEDPSVRYNDKFDGITPLERALINHNYEGAEILVNSRNILGHDVPHGLVYHQVRAGELSLWDDLTPVEFIVKHSPDQVVEGGLIVGALLNGGTGKLKDNLYNLGADPNMVLQVACSVCGIIEDEKATEIIKEALDRGASFSHNEYAGVLRLACQETDSLGLLKDFGLDLNENDGAILKSAINSFDSKVFKTLVDAGADPGCLKHPVGQYVAYEGPVTSDLSRQILKMQRVVDDVVQSEEISHGPSLS